LARPLTAAEKAAAKKLAGKYGQAALEDTVPIQMVGSGANLNEATDNGVARLAELLDMPAGEVLNRVTVSGAVEIGRLPGVVTVTMLAPLDRLEKGLAELIKEQYGL
jgi:formamidase